MKLLVQGFLVLAFISIATAEVVQSFTNCCDGFFANRIEPSQLTGDQYRKICQKRNGRYEFATLYDTRRKIPVYSAYLFQEKGTCKRGTSWFIEPQLDDPNGGSNMATEGTVKDKGRKQALNADYVKSNYHRGHLVPVFHRGSQTCVEATFTLTNAAPQNGNFNQRSWKKMESNTAKILTDRCLNRGFTAYVVTGVVPGRENIGHGVNVPKSFWSAYCCNDNNGIHKLSGANYGLNVANSRVESMSVAQLSDRLSEDYMPGFRVFSDNCQSLWEQISNVGTSSFRRGKIRRVKTAGKRRSGIVDRNNRLKHQ